MTVLNIFVTNLVKIVRKTKKRLIFLNSNCEKTLKHNGDRLEHMVNKGH